MEDLCESVPSDTTSGEDELNNTSEDESNDTLAYRAVARVTCDLDQPGPSVNGINVDDSQDEEYRTACCFFVLISPSLVSVVFQVMLWVIWFSLGGALTTDEAFKISIGFATGMFVFQLALLCLHNT